MKKFIVTIFCISLMTSCQQPLSNYPSQSQEGVLSFASVFDMQNALKQVLNMTPEERIQWEKRHCFVSYQTYCEQLFENFENKGINSDDDVYRFVKENSDYFYIREEDGELYLSTYLDNSIDRYLLNRHRNIRLNDNLLVYNNLSYSVEDSCTIMPVEGIKKKCDTCCSCYSNNVICRMTNGNNRTLVEVSLVNVQYPEGYMFESSYLVRPYQKTLGIWYWCRRTISYSLSASWNCQHTQYTSLVMDNGQASGETKAYAVEGLWGTPRPWAAYLYYYTDVDGFGDTPDTDICELDCQF